MPQPESFEDEKQRIIESCFTDSNDDGQPMETYLTHIRVQDCILHLPSSSPPPHRAEDIRKERFIIIARRSTGTARLHKARENADGSFSIGRTWNIEDLASIESFSNATLPSTSEQEARMRAWASDAGFVVTFEKGCYWRASSAEEKERFIEELVKTLTDRTGGQMPVLRGVDIDQTAQLTAAPSSSVL
ncbi:uncharacterized protein LTR77_007387 [Saxophila tyrrhenica]|uniref:Exocyst complex component Sec3 PIP2-binding N-terminal domain-containing protein n=1 Tax=Saxophila tyrrhenica TaxID=1690608 RepID=A0AAV9P593_9PEZI|nr:hypothetical protein LTR77_007387 [Saxophila tyrrhenica]